MDTDHHPNTEHKSPYSRPNPFLKSPPRCTPLRTSTDTTLSECLILREIWLFTCILTDNFRFFLLSDLFDMLLPMLGIYQEYVRNHHYSLQVLAEYKQKLDFNRLLKRYEEKPVCEGRSLATFLTYPMHQVTSQIT